MTLTENILAWWATAQAHLDHAGYLYVIPFAVLFIIWLVRHDFVKLAEDRESRAKRVRQQWVILFLRSVAVTALLIALASPFVERPHTVSDDPSLNILVDHSQSMSVYSDDIGESLKAKLEGAVQVELQTIASGRLSPIGEGILNGVHDGDTVVLVTDGQANLGAPLGDVALFASAHNITFNAITLEPKTDDAYVLVEGPDKTVENVDTSISVLSGWSTSDAKPLHVTVTIDGAVVLDTTDVERAHVVTRKFGQGYHRIEARVTDNDVITENNVFYKVIKVVPKPAVFLWAPTSNSPVEQLLRQVYDVTQAGSLPVSLDDYYSVIADDVPISAISQDETARLSDYVEDGNGLVVIGGRNAYDKGGYKNTYFETLLPVVVGTPGKEEGDVNVVVLMDASQSVSSEEGGGLAIAKKLTLDIINQMSPNVKLGVTAFRNIAYTVSPMGYKYEQSGLADKISTVYGTGGSKMHLGILESIDLLKAQRGAKHLIIISDGMLFPNDLDAAVDAVKLARKNGITVYTVGGAIGTDAFVADRVDERAMQEIAAAGSGIYFRAKDTSRFSLLFGNVKAPNPEAVTEWSVSVLDSNHFITQDLETNATITGYNAVAPKTTGRMLVTTHTGEPILTTWNLGLGRVAAYSTDDGTGWAGQLLGAGNSKLVVRAMNWANGDPDRKRPAYVDIKDTRVNEAALITVKASQQPTADGIGFYKVRPDTYEASVTPTTAGFHELLGAMYAANYPVELGPLGPSSELGVLLSQTGGRYFTTGEADKLVEFAKAHSVKTVTGKDYLRWYFAVAAAVLFLIEVFLRRLMRR